jgi:glycosyltransferase involved in cell wall biosynthesis
MSVCAVIPAHDEAPRIAATVRAVATVSGVDLVIVVCDGCTDGTAGRARAAGAIVIEQPRRAGKGAAMVAGAAVAAAFDVREGLRPGRHLLFLDADLGASAADARRLVDAVTSGTTDMAIGRLPHRPGGGGHGYVVRLARDGIGALTGWQPMQPLSGQRCLRRATFDRVRPLAHGYGVETGLTIDVLRSGGRVVEVDTGFEHRVTGRDVAAHLHRARQLVDVGRALTARALPPPVLVAARRARGMTPTLVA